MKEHNLNWLQFPDHRYRILITGGSGSGKTNSLINLICNHLDIDKFDLNPKDPIVAKHQLLIRKRKGKAYRI